MSEEYERTTVTQEPTRTVEVRRGSAAGWWVAALAGIVAIVAVVFLYNNRSAQDLQVAREQGRSEAAMAAASESAQQAAATAAQAAQDAAAGAAAATETAAQAAADQTEEMAATAGDAARDASDAVPSP
jgi:hypothetical protein